MGIFANWQKWASHGLRKICDIFLLYAFTLFLVLLWIDVDLKTYFNEDRRLIEEHYLLQKESPIF